MLFILSCYCLFDTHNVYLTVVIVQTHKWINIILEHCQLFRKFIYPTVCHFLSSTFLKELENCCEKPELVGACFLKRVCVFCMYTQAYRVNSQIVEWHLRISSSKLILGIFLLQKEELQIYEKYCQNKPRSEALWRQCGDSLFFQV